MNRITVNGVTYNSKGDISVKNGNVYVDGELLHNTGNEKVVNIIIGEVENLQVDSCETITIHGSAGNVKSQAGDIKIEGNVSGDVKTQAGDIRCGNVGGSVKTQAGDIKYVK